MTRRARNYVQHLAQVPFFSECTNSELKSLAARTTDVTVARGQILIREGHGAYEFFVIVEGEADVSRHGGVVARLGWGEFFGELALLDRALRDATVTAATPMEIIVLPQWDFQQALEEAPGMARKLLAGMARRLRRLDEKEPGLHPSVSTVG